MLKIFQNGGINDEISYLHFKSFLFFFLVKKIYHASVADVLVHSAVDDVW